MKQQPPFYTNIIYKKTWRIAHRARRARHRQNDPVLKPWGGGKNQKNHQLRFWKNNVGKKNSLLQIWSGFLKYPYPSFLTGKIPLFVYILSKKKKFKQGTSLGGYFNPKPPTVNSNNWKFVNVKKYGALLKKKLSIQFFFKMFILLNREQTTSADHAHSRYDTFCTPVLKTNTPR